MAYSNPFDQLWNVTAKFTIWRLLLIKCRSFLGVFRPQAVRFELVSTVEIIQTMPVEISSIISAPSAETNVPLSSYVETLFIKLRKFSQTFFKHVHLSDIPLNLSFRENACNFKIFPFSRHFRGYYISRKTDKFHVQQILLQICHYFSPWQFSSWIHNVKPTKFFYVMDIFAKFVHVRQWFASKYIYIAKASRKWKFSMQPKAELAVRVPTCSQRKDTINKMERVANFIA